MGHLGAVLTIIVLDFRPQFFGNWLSNKASGVEPQSCHRCWLITAYI